jgi:3-dehydroquinate synthase
MLSAGFGRDSAVIALGGGVTGDLAGFVSATYMRGIPYIQVPTTLLAMVDSSIGGKTGIDVGAGKNLIGAFHQPVAVFIDPQLLSTLPKKHIRNGMAELAKHAVIADERFFSFLEENLEHIFELDEDMLEKALKRSCEIKAEVVEKDEREAGLRQILNYGHTIGHAIEKLSGYKILHGEAVAVGMMVEGLISCEMGYMEVAELQRQNKLLRKLGFSPRILGRFKVDDIISAMRTDKKVREGKMKMVLPRRIGEMASSQGEWSHPVRKNILVRAITRISETII